MVKRMQNDKTIVIFAPRSFPFGTNEVPFLFTEFLRLAEVCNLTIVAAGYKADETQFAKEFDSYKNTIEAYNIDYQSMSLLQRIIWGMKAAVNPIFCKEFFAILKTRKNLFMRIYQATLLFSYALYYSKKLDKLKVLPRDNEFTFYSYWYDVQTMGAMLLKKKYPNMKIVSRIHGFDLYNEQRPGQYQPFRKWMDNNIHKLFFVSETGKNYYLNHFAINSGATNKYDVCYLGSCGEGEFSPQNHTNIFEIVSCSSLIPLKRVNLIIEALELLPKTIKVHWVHFGDGICKDDLIKEAMVKLDCCNNIRYEFKGMVSNEQIMNYYLNNAVDCFINVSTTEGLPVSAQEALGYGIPVVLTDVGGNRELVSENGILLPSNPKPEEIAAAINKIINLDDADRCIMHVKSMELWKNEFNAKKNAMNFVENLNLD